MSTGRADRVIRAAVVQATPVVLDGQASVHRACDLIGEAAARGARVVALPEAFIALKPQSCWGHWMGLVYGSDEAAAVAELFRRMWNAAVDVGGEREAALRAAARAHGVWVSIGVNERDVRRPGTLWNTMLWLAPDGTLAGRHRKLIPTGHERTFWGHGPGDDLGAIDAGFARLGGLICWENFMPAARRRLHREGVDLYLAPSADDRDLWTAAVRTFAFEAGAYVLSSIQYLRRSDFPADFPLADALDGCPDVHLSGGSVICDPWGEVIAGPVRGREEILVADLDLDRILAARRVLDTAGHYDRPGLSPG